MTETRSEHDMTEETRRVVTSYHNAAENAEKPLSLETLVRAYRDVMADDVRYELKGNTPISGVFNGIDDFVEKFLVPAMKLLTDVEVFVDEIFCEGERAVCLFRNRAKGPTGLPYCNDYATVYRVRNGKIIEAVEYLDTELTHTAMFGMPNPCKDGHVCLGHDNAP